MSELSPRLALPFLQPAQAQKHVTHNEALERLDLLVQLTVNAFDAATPPDNPPEGMAYALADEPIGAWTGQGGRIASWRNGGWLFVTPQDGWRAWARDTGGLHVFSTDTWQEVSPAQHQPVVGVNTSADTTNRLSVAATATLLSHDGAGHQLKVNKASAADTASLLFQSGFSGRAEIGLAGNDDLAIKVSPDGSQFETALSVDSLTGMTALKCMTSVRLTLADDASGTIPLPAAAGFVLVSRIAADSSPSFSGHSGIFVYGDGTCLTLAKGDGIDNLGDQPLTGTTGTIGQTTITILPGLVCMENRSGAGAIYALTFIGG